MTDTFTRAYFEAMEFTDCHSDNPELDNADGFSAELIEQSERDCAKFQAENAGDLSGIGSEQAGHDFWLTRNGHGAGFWDRGLGALGERLTAAAHAFGQVDLYTGDDNMIYGG